MERKDWLKVVYEAACRVAEEHGSGLRAAVEAREREGDLHNLILRVSSEVIAGSGDIWPFIAYSRHPEPEGDDWRSAPTFEGAVIRAAVSALGADIRDILEDLAGGRMPTVKAMRPAESGPADQGDQSC